MHIVVEFPGLVKNTEKAIQCLGSLSSINKSFSGSPLYLRLRPTDPSSRPIVGQSKRFVGFLFKIQVKSKKTNVSQGKDDTDSHDTSGLHLYSILYHNSPSRCATK